MDEKPHSLDSSLLSLIHLLITFDCCWNVIRHHRIAASPTAVVLEFILSSSLAAGLAVRYQLQIVRSPAAPVQSISQHGRQRLTAAATRHPPHATGNRLPALPTSSRRPAEPARSRARAWQPLLRPENPPALPISACGLLAAHLMPRATPDAAAPEDRFPRRQTPPHLKTVSPDGRRRPSRYNCICKRSPEARRAPWPCPPP